MDTPELPADEPRYPIRRRGGRARCEDCDPQRDVTAYILWLPAAEARQRGLTHCTQCKRPLVPLEDSPEA